MERVKNSASIYTRHFGVRSHLVQLPAETLENILLIDLEHRLSLIEDCVHDHAQRVHVRDGVTADGQDVLRSHVFRIRQAEGGQIGVPLFTYVFGL